MRALIKKFIPRRARYQLRQIGWALRHVPRWRRSLSWSAAIRLALAEPVALRFGLLAGIETYELQVPGRHQVVVLRPYTSDFEVFVHPVSRMEEIVRRAGFALARRRGSWVWGADIYIRNRMAPKS